MSLYRCAACGSPNVVADTQKEGYNYVKGAIGTVVLGVGGAAAGINGKEIQVFKCPDCGLTLNYSMSTEIKTLIDIGVDRLNARENLVIDGMRVPWEVLTKNYKNIEQGMADRELQESQTKDEQNKNTRKKTIDSLIETIKKEFNTPVDTSEQKAWEIINIPRKEAKEKALKQLEQEHTLLIQRIDNDVKQEMSQNVRLHTERKNELKQKTKNLLEEKNVLGLFKFAEKTKIKNQILTIEQEIQKEDELIANYSDSDFVENEIYKARDRYFRDNNYSYYDIEEDIKNTYFISESPKDKANIQKQIEIAMENENPGSISKEAFGACMKFIFYYADSLNKEELAQVIKECFNFDISPQRASNYGRNVVSKSETIKYESGVFLSK